MDWQTYIAISIVALTATIFIVRFFRPKKNGSCGHDCGCGKKPR
ncbi:MAG: FeoB-associated Cys-rich membrane protein [Gloeobacteraceae cyanobacterium ES-bin-144]|nr:FeoB-associated Cys-rich membrane protein [Verrucomicrobiales bacterium]